MKMSKILSTGIVALALTLSMGASAAIKGTDLAVRVDVQDLDLTTVQGKQVLHARLKRAAKQVCGSQDVRTAGSLENARTNRACYNEALAGAVQSVENRYLTAYHQGS